MFRPKIEIGWTMEISLQSGQENGNWFEKDFYICKLVRKQILDLEIGSKMEIAVEIGQ